MRKKSEKTAAEENSFKFVWKMSLSIMIPRDKRKKGIMNSFLSKLTRKSVFNMYYVNEVCECLWTIVVRTTQDTGLSIVLKNKHSLSHHTPIISRASYFYSQLEDDRTIYHFKASRSGNHKILCSSETSGNGSCGRFGRVRSKHEAKSVPDRIFHNQRT